MSDQITILERFLRNANDRHRILVSNVANVDTPNYRAKDVTFTNVLGAEMSLAVTDPKHLRPDNAAGGGEVTVAETEPWADKNNVELDLEVAKMTENAMQFQAGTTLLQAKIRMFKSALRTR